MYLYIQVNRVVCVSVSERVEHSDGMFRGIDGDGASRCSRSRGNIEAASGSNIGLASLHVGREMVEIGTLDEEAS